MSKHSIKNVPRYFVTYTSDCFQNAYGALVSYLKLDPEIILADYLSFIFDPGTGYIGLNFLHKPSTSFEFSEEELNTSLEYVYFPAVTCYSKFIPKQTKELSSDKIKIYLYYNDNPEIAHSRLKELINNDIPVITVVDLHFMKYHRAYQKDHGAHAVIVTGYNEEEGYVELFDKYSLSNSDFDGKIPLEEFMLARGSEICLGEYSKPIRNLWMEVSKNSEFLYNDTRWQTVIEESCKRMQGEKDLLGIKCGLPAIESLRRELLINKQELPPQEIFPIYRYYYNAAFKIISRSRIRFGMFLRQLDSKLPKELVEDTILYLEASARKWEIISNLSLRLALTKNADSIENLCKYLSAIENDESRAVESLMGCMRISLAEMVRQ